MYPSQDSNKSRRRKRDLEKLMSETEAEFEEAAKKASTSGYFEIPWPSCPLGRGSTSSAAIVAISDVPAFQQSMSTDANMSNGKPQTLLNICRFCLSRDEENLIPMENVLLLTLTLEDIALFADVKIEEEDKTLYAMCVNCTTQLKSCSTFRQACLANEAHFHELCDELIAKEKAPRIDATKAAIAALLAEEEEEPERGQPSPVQHYDTIELVDSDDEFSYSANYINPGEVLHIEEVVYGPPNWDVSLNPAFRPVTPQPNQPGKRRLHLCEKCGLKTGHLKSHYLDHLEVSTAKCPYCPVMMKHKKTLREHILTVHFKTIMKTCEICGKGFVHHKTYRYHMISHLEQGETHECIDCSKTFSNSIYLRDHINRVHNPARKTKFKDTTGTEKRIRIRSRNPDDYRVERESTDSDSN